MTATLDKPPVQPWSAMPGWGIVVDLLPPEIVSARRVRVIRKLLGSVLAVIAALAVLGYGYASWQVHSASSALGEVQARTVHLQQAQLRFRSVLTVRAETTHVADELAALTQADVDLPPLLGKVVAASPRPSRITKVDVEITAAAPQTATAATSDETGSLDSSGRLHVGTVTVDGGASSVAQVAAYVRRLAGLPGVVEVFPVSAQANGHGVDYVVELTLTDQLLGRAGAAGPSRTGGK